MEGALAQDAALVELDDVSYAYEGETEPVLRSVSLRVWPGEFILILGPSGCGKSTLLHLLNGTIPHTLKGTLTGEARVCGKRVVDTKVASFATDVGTVFQDPEGQIVNIRVRDEVCFGLENLRRPREEILARCGESLSQVGLEEFGDRSVFDLSGGQKQRVSIAAVLAASPRLLVLDEPTANLDPQGMAEIFAVLHRLNRESGTTVVTVEHRVDELADRVSRVIMMEGGRIVFDGPPREAFSRRRGARRSAEGHGHDTRAGDAGVGGTRDADADVVPPSAWFPQASELALAIDDASQADPVRDVPLNVREAIAHARTRLGTGSTAVPPVASRARPPGRPLLSVRGLRYGYERSRPILHGIDLDLSSGGIVALCGRNGSGKTTFARLITRINQPPRGAIWLEERDVAGMEARDVALSIGYVFQNPDHQFVTDQVWDEVAYGLRVRDYADEAVRERVDEILGITDLLVYRDRSPFSLSLGERRRLSVATMLVLEPRLLLLDEPTIGQDHERAQELMGLMVRLRERYDTTVLMITHDVRLVAEWADRAVVIGDGHKLFDGAPIDMFADEALMDAAGLLAPPVFSISAALAHDCPDAGITPTLSLPALAHAVATARCAREEALP